MDILEIMNEVLIFLGRLSLGEFIFIWTSTIVVVLFYLFLFYDLIKIEQDLDLLRVKIKRISELL
jgi:hypothetical protein